MTKKIITFAIATLFLLSFIASSSAITGRLGNSRMILTLDEGETVERSLLIQNFNDVKLTIELDAAGALADSIEIRDTMFELSPGEEKKAFFTVTADKPGTTESKINVRFTPEEGNGIGLSSTIIVIAPGENEETEDDGGILGFLGGNDEEAEVSEEDEPGVNVGFGNNPNSQVDSGSQNSEGMSAMSILGISTVVLIIIFVVLMVYANNKNKTKAKKRQRRPRA